MNEQTVHHRWTPLEELHVARELLRLHQCPARQILYSPEQSHARALEKRLLTQAYALGKAVDIGL